MNGKTTVNEINIVDSWDGHVKDLLKTLRPADKLEAERLGLDPDKAVYQSYHSALYRKTGLVDGEVAAMWGVSGTPLSLIGHPYLITGSLVETISPRRFITIYKEEVQRMKQLFPVLENYVDADYKSAVRVLKISGFKLEGPLVLNNNFYKYSIGN